MKMSRGYQIYIKGYKKDGSGNLSNLKELYEEYNN